MIGPHLKVCVIIIFSQTKALSFITVQMIATWNSVIPQKEHYYDDSTSCTQVAHSLLCRPSKQYRAVIRDNTAAGNVLGDRQVHTHGYKVYPWLPAITMVTRPYDKERDKC